MLKSSLQLYSPVVARSNTSLQFVSQPQLWQFQSASFSKFRKRLGIYSYKITKQSSYKNPHAIPLQRREQYRKSGEWGQRRMNEVEKWSMKPFGRFTRKGKFKIDLDRVPFYNIPDLEGFELKPYVSHSTPKMAPDFKVQREVEIDEETLVRIEALNKKMQDLEGIEAKRNIDPLSELNKRRSFFS